MVVKFLLPSFYTVKGKKKNRSFGMVQKNLKLDNNLECGDLSPLCLARLVERMSDPTYAQY